MPIYEYRCSACGFEKDALQKLSDPPLRDCPQCGQPALVKLISAAGFQLKGSGWYATDFKGSGSKPQADKPQADKPDAAKGEGANATTETKAADKASTPAASDAAKPATPPAPGG